MLMNMSVWIVGCSVGLSLADSALPMVFQVCVFLSRRFVKKNDFAFLQVFELSLRCNGRQSVLVFSHYLQVRTCLSFKRISFEHLDWGVNQCCGYDNSPSGKLVQIEHALTAVGSGQTSLGIKGLLLSMMNVLMEFYIKRF